MSGRKENKAQRDVGRPGVWEATGERAGPPECYFSWEIRKAPLVSSALERDLKELRA